SRLETVTPPRVVHVNLRPRRHQKNPPMVTMSPGEPRQHPLARMELEGRSGVDQSSIEEHPAGESRRACAIGEGHCNGAASEPGCIDPRQRQAVAAQLLLDDP